MSPKKGTHLKPDQTSLTWGSQESIEVRQHENWLGESCQQQWDPCPRVLG
jgi:hypothetical protein